MAIRIKNLDLNTEAMKGYSTVFLGDVTATRPCVAFVAPVDCVVEAIDIVSKQNVPPTANTASVSIITVVARLATNSDSTLQSRGTSANGVSNSDNIVANQRYRLIPSANNSLTVGTPIELMFSQGGSASLSAAVVMVTYRPQKHRGNR